MGSIPVLKTNETIDTLTKENKSVGDDSVIRAMLRMLERVVEAHTGTVARGFGTKRLRLNEAELFRGFTNIAPTVAEYWLKATECIMDDLKCTPAQKLRGAVSLLHDESYQWWLTIEQSLRPDVVTWDAFKGKYIGANNIEARRREFMNLEQGDMLVAEYETEFLRLSCYAQALVAIEYDNVRLEDKLRYELKVLIAS